MSETDIISKIIKTIPFDGKIELYRMWSRKFKVKMDMQGYDDIFDDDVSIPGVELGISEGLTEPK